MQWQVSNETGKSRACKTFEILLPFTDGSAQVITVQAAQPAFQAVTTTPSATAGHVAVTAAIPQQQQIVQVQQQQQLQVQQQQQQQKAKKKGKKGKKASLAEAQQQIVAQAQFQQVQQQQLQVQQVNGLIEIPNEQATT